MVRKHETATTTDRQKIRRSNYFFFSDIIISQQSVGNSPTAQRMIIKIDKIHSHLHHIIIPTRQASTHRSRITCHSARLSNRFGNIKQWLLPYLVIDCCVVLVQVIERCVSRGYFLVPPSELSLFAHNKNRCYVHHCIPRWNDVSDFPRVLSFLLCQCLE